MKRDFDRQVEFKRRVLEKESKKPFENHFAINESEIKHGTKSTSIQTNDVIFEDKETQTVTISIEVETQTEENADHKKKIVINEKGEIHAKPDETIVELKFYMTWKTGSK